MVPVFMMVLLCFTSYSLSTKFDKLEVDRWELLVATITVTLPCSESTISS